MYEEPFRWIEAVGNRRQYLDDQFRHGSPIVAVPYADGILLVTFSRGTPKLYEIYDRIALGGMGHPADLEKVRFSLLDMAHLEGFNRSPSDVTGTRLMKYGVAPVIKQAFEEIFKAPLITKILLAELGKTSERNQFLTIDYDGSFEESQSYAVVAAASSIQMQMAAFLKGKVDGMGASLHEAFDLSIKTWSFGSLLQKADQVENKSEKSDDEAESHVSPSGPDEDSILAHIKETLTEHSLECVLLDRTVSGPSKYRCLPSDEAKELFPSVLQSAV